jgi:hypothetical protein
LQSVSSAVLDEGREAKLGEILPFISAPWKQRLLARLTSWGRVGVEETEKPSPEGQKRALGGIPSAWHLTRLTGRLEVKQQSFSLLLYFYTVSGVLYCSSSAVLGLYR